MARLDRRAAAAGGGRAGALEDCPVCRAAGALERVAAAGFWERQVLGLLALRPYRCSRCGSRILRFSRGRAPTGAASAPPPPPAELAPLFLPDRDASDFAQLIAELREAEQKIDYEDR